MKNTKPHKRYNRSASFAVVHRNHFRLNQEWEENYVSGKISMKVIQYLINNTNMLPENIAIVTRDYLNKTKQVVKIKIIRSLKARCRSYITE